LKKHIKNTAKNMKTLVNRIQKLAGTRWGANAVTVKRFTIDFMHRTTVYGALLLVNSIHVTSSGA